MQISEYTSPDIWPFGGTSGIMRTYANATFVDVDGKIVWVGIPNQTDTPCYESPFTINDRRVALPVVELPDTTDSPTVPMTQWTSILFDESDTPRIYFLGGPYTTPAWLASPTTWDQVAIANAGANITWPTAYYLSAAEVEALIAAAVTGANAPKASTIIYGSVVLNIAADDSSAPEVTGANTPVVVGNDGVAAIARYANFGAAIASIGGTETTLLINSPITTDSVTVPSTLLLQFTVNGRLTVNNGQMVTINSKPNLIPGKQYFFGEGRVVFDTNAAIAGVDLSWWAQDGDDVTTSLTDAITSVDNCGGGVVTIPTGTYGIATTIAVPNGVTIQGQGHTYDTSPSVTTFRLLDNIAAFTVVDAFRNITFENLRIDGVTAHVGQMGVVATGAQPDSAFGLHFRNVVFNNLEDGVRIFSTTNSPPWQVENITFDGCQLFNCTRYAFYNNSINTAVLWNGGNIFIPAGGVGLQLDQCGDLVMILPEFGGDGTGIVVDGIHSGMTFIGLENEGNDYLLRNNLSDLNVAISFRGGTVQSKIRSSAATNFLFEDVEFTGANLFVLDAGIGNRYSAIMCPGFDTALQDNSAGNAIETLAVLTDGTVRMGRKITMRSDVTATTPIANFLSALADKRLFAYGECDPDGTPTNIYKWRRREPDGYSQAEATQASPNRGYSFNGPLELNGPSNADVSAPSNTVRFRLNAANFPQISVDGGAWTNWMGTQISLPAGTIPMVGTDGKIILMVASLLSKVGLNLQIASGLLQFFGATASFPALKRSATGLALRLADDSGYGPWDAQNITAHGDLAVTGNAAVTGNVAVNTNKFTIAGSTGNSVCAGTFNVTGALTGSAAVVGTQLVATGGVSNDFKVTIPSAATVTPTGNSVEISGAVTITAIGTNGVNGGAIVTFYFTSTPTVTNGANLVLAGGTDFVAVANDTLQLMYVGASKWVEVGRSVNH